MPTRRLDDRIRFLCSKLVALPDNKDSELLAQELLAAIHEKVRRVRKLAKVFLCDGEGRDERRSRQK